MVCFCRHSTATQISDESDLTCCQCLPHVTGPLQVYNTIYIPGGGYNNTQKHTCALPWHGHQYYYVHTGCTLSKSPTLALSKLAWQCSASVAWPHCGVLECQ